MSPATPPMITGANDNNTTTPRHQSYRHPPPPTDCWSAEETHALIKAWGSRHLSLNRGPLRQHQWTDVADTVNSYVTDKNNRRRTDAQCKNRIDTLKKKYKIEKAKAAADKSYVSTWPFFSRLDFLVAAADKPSPSPSPAIVTPAPPPSTRTFPVKKRSAIPKRPARWLTEDDDEVDDDDENQKDRQLSSGGGVYGGCGGGWRAESKEEERGEGFGFGCRKLAEAIVRFGEVYERVESMKQEQLIELEKQRMKFAKDLEFQRIKLLMETQVHLMSQFKRCKHTHHHSDLDSYL